MPANTNIAVPASTWTQLTSADVTAIRVQHDGQRVWIMGTVGAVAPVGSPSALGAVFIDGGRVLAADLTLAQLFPGVASTRVYAYSDQAVSVSVSHA